MTQLALDTRNLVAVRGVAAFLLSTVVFTTFGEILPQAYLSRNALHVSSILSPLFRFVRVLPYPIAKPVALLLEKRLGKEVMDADGFLRDALFSDQSVDPGRYCRRPIVATDPQKKIGAVLSRWTLRTLGDDDVIDNDLMLFWRESKKVITDADNLSLPVCDC